MELSTSGVDGRHFRPVAVGGAGTGSRTRDWCRPISCEPVHLSVGAGRSSTEAGDVQGPLSGP